MSFDWSSIIHEISIKTNDSYWYTVSGKNISWSVIPQVNFAVSKASNSFNVYFFQYPACQTLDMWDYFNFHHQAPLRIEFYMNPVPNLGLSLRIESRNMMTSRALKSNMLSYTGPDLKISNISLNREVR